MPCCSLHCSTRRRMASCRLQRASTPPSRSIRPSCASSAYSREIAGVLVGWCLVVASRKLTTSKYNPRAGSVFARSTRRSEATPSASTGGRASAFCEPVRTKSSARPPPQRSVSTGEPASDVTASTSNSTSSNSRTTAASAATSCSTPVDVSEWTRVTASTGVRRSASRSMSGSTAQPSGTSSRMHSLPQAPTSFANRSLNDPLTSESARWRTPLRTASSMNPVADDEQPGMGSPFEQALHRRLVTHVGGHAVQHDVFGVEQVEHCRHVLVGEHVEPMLEEEQVARMTAQPVGERRRVAPRGLDHERVAQCRLGDLLLARSPTQTVCREGGLPVRLLRDLGMAHEVIVGARDDPNAVTVGVVGEPLQVWNDVLGLGHVQLAVGPHEVVLGVDVPEDDPGHAPFLGIVKCLEGGRRVSTGRRPTTSERPRSRHSSSGGDTWRSPPTP